MRNFQHYKLTSPLVGLVGAFGAYSWLRPPAPTVDFTPYEPVQWWVPISTGLSISLIITFLHKIPSSTSTFAYLHMLSFLGSFGVAVLTCNAVQKSKTAVRDTNVTEVHVPRQHKGQADDVSYMQSITRQTSPVPADRQQKNINIAYLGVGVAMVGGLLVIATL